MKHFNLKALVIGVAMLSTSLHAYAFDAKNITTTVTCFPGANCIFNVEVPSSDAMTSFHVQVKSDPSTLSLTAVTPDTWTTGIESGGVFFQGSSFYGDLKFVIGMNKSDIISWSYDYQDSSGNTVVTPPIMIPEPEVTGLLIAGLVVLGYRKKCFKQG